MKNKELIEIYLDTVEQTQDNKVKTQKKIFHQRKEY